MHSVSVQERVSVRVAWQVAAGAAAEAFVAGQVVVGAAAVALSVVGAAGEVVVGSSVVGTLAGAAAMALEGFAVGDFYSAQAGKFVFEPAGCLGEPPCFCARNPFLSEHSTVGSGWLAKRFATGVKNSNAGRVFQPEPAARRQAG